MTSSAVKELADLILIEDAKQATKYVAKNKTIKATRRGPLDKRRNQIEILFTFGAPNFEERANLKSGRAKVGMTITKY